LPIPTAILPASSSSSHRAVLQKLTPSLQGLSGVALMGSLLPELHRCIPEMMARDDLALARVFSMDIQISYRGHRLHGQPSTQQNLSRVIHGLTTVMNSTLMPFPIDKGFPYPPSHSPPVQPGLRSRCCVFPINHYGEDISCVPLQLEQGANIFLNT
jgi:hypothetical protein